MPYIKIINIHLLQPDTNLSTLWLELRLIAFTFNTVQKQKYDIRTVIWYILYHPVIPDSELLSYIIVIITKNTFSLLQKKKKGRKTGKKKKKKEKDLTTDRFEQLNWWKIQSLFHKKILYRSSIIAKINLTFATVTGRCKSCVKTPEHCGISAIEGLCFWKVLECYCECQGLELTGWLADIHVERKNSWLALNSVM